MAGNSGINANWIPMQSSSSNRDEDSAQPARYRVTCKASTTNGITETLSQDPSALKRRSAL